MWPLVRASLLLVVPSVAHAGADELLHFQSRKQFPGGSAGAIDQVVLLMKDLSAQIEQDGKEELTSYDKYSCWCEDTLAKKAKDISDAKQHIDGLQTLVQKLQGEIATHGAEIQNLNKLIADNKASQAEAEEVRAQDASEYENEKTESEQCIGALEAAIKALSGAGTGNKGFLETLQEAQLLSVRSGMESVLKHPVASEAVSNQDLAMVRNFFDQPSRFEGRRSGLAAVQLSNNPFGDYAPQSTRIQGVLKGLYDAFTSSLEKANVAEAEAVKSHEAFIATKKAEQTTLADTLERQELDKTSKAKQMADSKLLRQDTQEQLKADEEFFATTKGACEKKAQEWSTRVRMRTEELQGIDKAVQILSSEENTEVFKNSTNTFLQLSATKAISRRLAALQSIARKYHSQSVAKIASAAKARGYFDKVIGDIDSMIALLRKEEAMDIEHRDRCQAAENKNKNDKEDLASDIEKSKAAVEVLQNEESELKDSIEALAEKLKASEADKEEMLKMRNTEREKHEHALLMDQKAEELITKAIESLAAFYKRNNLNPTWIQKKQEPEYSVDPDTPPETSWDSKEYTGRQSEHVGVTAILEMIREDVRKEMEVARSEEAEAQAEYKKQETALKESISAQEETKASSQKELAELQAKVQAKEEYQNSKSEDLEGEKKLESSIYDDCSWVSGTTGPSFETRAAKRKAELEGLAAAKSYLAGVEDGTALDATFAL